MEINTEKIGLFLKELNNWEFAYLQRVLQIVQNINSLINIHNFTKEDIITKFKIKAINYDNFISGNYDYTLMDISRMNAIFMEIEIKGLKNNIEIKFEDK